LIFLTNSTIGPKITTEVVFVFRRISSLVLILCLLAFPTLGHAQQLVAVAFNGQPMRPGVSPYEVSAFIHSNGRTYLPARALLQAAGLRVAWDGDENTLTAQNSQHRVVLTVNSTAAVVDGQRVTLVAPPLILQGRVMLPIRPVMEALGATVSWDPTNRIVEVDFPTSGGPLFPLSQQDISTMGYTATPLQNYPGTLSFETPLDERFRYFPNLSTLMDLVNDVTQWPFPTIFHYCAADRIASVANGDGSFFMYSGGTTDGAIFGTAQNGYVVVRPADCMPDLPGFFRELLLRLLSSLPQGGD
jgi:hypothetical protein